MEIACALIDETALLGACDEGRVSPEDLWERVLRALEGIGAEVESDRIGEAFFVLDGLWGIHGGNAAGVLAAARGAAPLPLQFGVAPTRFAAFVIASGVTGGMEMAVPRHALHPFLAQLQVEALGWGDPKAGDLIETMKRLGIKTMGELAAIASARIADRFGPPGLRALRLARGEDEPLRPRAPYEELAEEIELPEGTAGGQLNRALELLIDRLLAAPQRRGRTILGLRLGALLSDGGSWSVNQGLSRPTASSRALRMVLTPRLEGLPAPAVRLRLRAVGLGPVPSDQLELSTGEGESRRRRLGAAVREVRTAQGANALLKILPIDTASRVPERRAMLTPVPEP